MFKSATAFLATSAIVSVAASVANADVTFSDVVIGGSLAGGATWNDSTLNGIDFVFPDATVGDVNGLTDGDISISFHGHSSEAGIGSSSVLLSVLGALSGSGRIDFSELVYDMDTGTLIADYKATFDSFDDLPAVSDIAFDYAASHIYVVKYLRLSAVDTDDFDFANVSLVEQDFSENEIPAPATGLLLGVGGLLFSTRRRRV